MENNVFDKMQEIAHMGSYETDLVNGTWTGSDHFIKMFELPEKDEYTEEEFQALVHPDDFEDVMNYFSTCLANQQDFNYDYRCITKQTRQVIYVVSRSEVSYDKDGSPLKVVGVKQDITDRKKNELERQRYIKELETKNNELEQFAYAASHDLQEPLRTVNSFVNLLNRQYGEQFDQDAQQYLTYIANASSRLSKLVMDLLNYSRIGKETTLTTVDCNDILTQLTDDLSTSIEEANATITVDDLPKINAYETELRLLFQHLLVNAIKFSTNNEQPKIHVRAQESNNQVQFSVQDNGIGIDPKYKEKIFMLFQRLHSSKDYEGTGIGLPGCRKIIDLHEGTIWVESTPGKGSTFHFLIPKNLSHER